MLWNLILIVFGVMAVYWVASINLFLGILLLLVIAAVMIYMRWTGICIMLAMRNHSKGDMQKAFEWFEKGYKHGMTNQQKVNYAYYLMRDGQLEKSEQVYTRLLGFRLPQDDRNYAKSNYAILLWKMGNIDGAIEELEEIFPYYRTTNVYGTLGYMYILKGDMKKAKEFNDEAYEYNNENTVILDNVTQVYEKLGLLEQAEKYADELMAQKPTFKEGLYDIAKVKLKCKKYDEARKALEAAYEIKPTFMTTVTEEQLDELKAQIDAQLPDDGQEDDSAQAPQVSLEEGRPEGVAEAEDEAKTEDSPKEV